MRTGQGASCRGVEKWVYMCAGSRNMRIHLKNHLPVKVMFQDYHINGLESNRVYELIIEIPNATTTELQYPNTPIRDTKENTGTYNLPQHDKRKTWWWLCNVCWR